MTLPAPKTLEEVREILKQYLLDMDMNISKEFDSGEFSGFWIIYGDFPLLIENRKPLKYCVVGFQITFSDEAAITTLNGYYNTEDHGFMFRLTDAFTSPQTSFIRVVEAGRVIGFTVMKSIYPFHEGFGIRDLDQAIQSVVSTGSVGISFLKSEMGQMSLEHTPQRPESEPGPMYE